jgi:hypothetical protein
MCWWKRVMLALAGLVLIACGIGWFATCLCFDANSEERQPR